MAQAASFLPPEIALQRVECHWTKVSAIPKNHVWAPTRRVTRDDISKTSQTLRNRRPPCEGIAQKRLHCVDVGASGGVWGKERGCGGTRGFWLRLHRSAVRSRFESRGEADYVDKLMSPRLARDRRLGSKQREQFWPVFAAARASLRSRGSTHGPAFSLQSPATSPGSPRNHFRMSSVYLTIRSGAASWHHTNDQRCPHAFA
jgi:hypothetical protein